MFPILFNFGIIKIYTVGVFLVLSFLTGSFLLWKNIKLTSYKEEEIFDGLFFSILGALLGARIVYATLHFQDIGFNILRFILINGYPGLSLFGALIGAFLTLFLYTRVQKISILDLIEYIISPLFLALTIGKVGSFLSGSDIGTQTNLFLNVRYMGVEGTRHIVALYEALLFLIGFIITYRLLFIVRRDRAKHGTSLFFFMTWFGLVELILDNLKQNHLYLAGLSFNTITASIFLTVGTVFFLTTYRQELGEKTKKLFSLKKKHDSKSTHTTAVEETQRNTSERGEETPSDD